MLRKPISLSIVTPTLNRLAMLQEAVGSVRAQRYPHVQHIIVDGGSTDGTRSWVEAQRDLEFLPPPDRGVYDAMNKGIATATGDFIGLLNSDDVYETGAFEAVAETITTTLGTDVVAGHSKLVDGDKIVARYETRAELLPDTREVLIGRCLPNPRFYRRALMQRIGPIDQRLGLVADRDYLVRLIEAKAVTVPLAAPLYVYRRHEGSLTFDADLKFSLRLRREMVALGRRWRDDATASSQTRAAGRELEGRQRLLLAVGALRSARLSDAAAHVFVDDGRGSTRPATAIAYAVLAAFTNTRSRR